MNDTADLGLFKEEGGADAAGSNNAGDAGASAQPAAEGGAGAAAPNPGDASASAPAPQAGGNDQQSQPAPVQAEGSQGGNPGGEGNNSPENQNQRGGGNNRGGGGGGNRNNQQQGQHQNKGGGGNNNNRNKNRKKKNKQKERKKDVPTGPPVEGEGLLEISSKGFGFLRQKDTNFQQAPSDIFVTPEVVREYGLRDGMWLKCMAREGNRGPQLSELLEICGKKPEECRDLPFFEELTAVNPSKRIIMETRPDLYTTRVIDLITPIGRGQRGLIVAPPRTGKTTLLQHMAEAVHQNHDYIKIMILLVDERPEEVTELQRALPFAEFMASSNDQDVRSHCRIAELAIERAKRMVEAGEHVFLLLDSITRMARAYNNKQKGGKNRGIQSGGLGVGALEIPRRLFAAARNTREAGSLTIIGTALVETNSRMDEAIFQEFKGTGNMELVLDRKIAEQYVWPAVNIHASGTRREELLLAGHQLEKVYTIRRGLAGHKPIEAMERILSLMEKFPNNAQLLLEIKAMAA